MKSGEVVKVFGRKVWIESDFIGDKHVVVQHDAPGCEPFTYCTFHYDYAYPSNSQQAADAMRVAMQLGATHPVEWRHREITTPPETPGHGE